MKRLWIVMLVLAGGLALATPAMAAKPDPPDCRGNSCNTESDGIGMTCEEAEALGFERAQPTWTGEKSFEVAMSRGSACVDVLPAAGTWTIEVVTTGSAREVYVAVRDSVLPGDTCWSVTEPGITEATVFSPELPAATVDACGDAEADEDPALVFNAWYSAGKLRDPVVVKVTLP